MSKTSVINGKAAEVMMRQHYSTEYVCNQVEISQQHLYNSLWCVISITDASSDAQGDDVQNTV